MTDKVISFLWLIKMNRVVSTCRDIGNRALGALEKLKTMKDDLGVLKVLSTYLWSNILTIPQGDRFQVNINSYVRCLSMPEKPIGTILIIQGGVRHMASNSYYVRAACLLLPKNIRVFLFEKLLPMVNFDFIHDVSDALAFLREQYPGPLCVIGYSMGGVVLWTYLGMGYDQADLYIPVCCPLDLDRFKETIMTHPLFKLEHSLTCRCYQVDGYEELLEFSGTTVEDQREYTDHFLENINQQCNNWLNKTIYILSSNDPITRAEDLKLLRNPPTTYVVEGGWHCCLDSTYLSAVLASNYIEAKSRGIQLNPEEISDKQSGIGPLKFID